MTVKKASGNKSVASRKVKKASGNKSVKGVMSSDVAKHMKKSSSSGGARPNRTQGTIAKPKSGLGVSSAKSAKPTATRTTNKMDIHANNMRAKAQSERRARGVEPLSVQRANAVKKTAYRAEKAYDDMTEKAYNKATNVAKKIKKKF